ncbi:broad specificity phosphatase PhoE [Leucobacter exalbidus]|uniref:Broad specificity phosphatase PhoE n=1 Tax=Leucobacter exalbidus TaxID=662960 RepID=A0A940T3H9_9MICO|nr:histidine phosphatase family protein [Leucobacter exalbidus]MBP1325769.1 broad specificity phosphatase PhoE [Leucobacter exalbidus]
MNVPLDTPIALVRHGETDWNRAARIQGRTEIPLNDTGKAQAAATAALLAAAGTWRGVRASPLGRAIQTAQILAAGLELAQPTIDEGLWERNFGEAEGLEVAHAQNRWPGLDGIPGSESVAEVAERSAAAITRVLDTAPGSIVVAHGAMLRNGLINLTGEAVPRILNGEVWLLFRTKSGMRTELITDPAAAQKLLQR